MALAWNAGWVNALRGSNPLSSAADAARSSRARAASLIYAAPPGRPRPMGTLATVTQHTHHTETAGPTVALHVLVYSSDAATRARVISALGTRPHPDLPQLHYTEVATAAVVLEHMDAGGVDLAILDGEAAPTGGLGLAKQLRDELDACPPLLALTGRPDDRWLADWSRADAAVPHPLDPFRLREAVTVLLARD